MLRKLFCWSGISKFAVVLNHSYLALNGYGAPSVINEWVVSVASDLPPIAKIEKLLPSSHLSPERRECVNKTGHTTTIVPHLSLEDVDFGRSPSNIGAVRVDRTWMRFSRTRAPAQPLARQVGQNVIVARITPLERSLRTAIMRLVLGRVSFRRR